MNNLLIFTQNIPIENDLIGKIEHFGVFSLRLQS